MGKYTAGPWSVEDNYIVSEGFKEIAVIISNRSNVSDKYKAGQDEARANACLIVRSVELYESCDRLISEWGSVVPDLTVVKQCKMKLKKLINEIKHDMAV